MKLSWSKKAVRRCNLGKKLGWTTRWKGSSLAWEYDDFYNDYEGPNEYLEKVITVFNFLSMISEKLDHFNFSINLLYNFYDTKNVVDIEDFWLFLKAPSSPITKNKNATKTCRSEGGR